MYLKKKGSSLVESIVILFLVVSITLILNNVIINNYKKKNLYVISEDIRELTKEENRFLYEIEDKFSSIYKNDGKEKAIDYLKKGTEKVEDLTFNYEVLNENIIIKYSEGNYKVQLKFSYEILEDKKEIKIINTYFRTRYI